MANIKVESEITDTICKVGAVVGQIVLQDDLLLIVESIKLEIPVTAPAKGRILEIKVRDSDTVTDQQPRTPILCGHTAAVHFVCRQGAGWGKMHGSCRTRPAGAIDAKGFRSRRSFGNMATNRPTRADGGNRS